MTRGDRLRLWAAWGGPALALGLVVLALAAKSHHEGWGAGVVWVTIGWSFALAGLVALTRRPENNTGRLLVWTGIAVLLAGLSVANGAVLYTIGEAFSAVLLAAFVHLVLAYPDGHLHSRAERAAVTFSYTLAVAANVGTLLFHPHPQCDHRCATNILLLHHSESVAHGITIAADILAVPLLVWVLVLVVRRARSSTPVVRRAMRGLLWTGGTSLALVMLGFAVGPVSEDGQTVLADIGLLVFAAVPYVLLAGLLRGRLAPGAVARRLVNVPETATLEETRDALREALGDPELRVGAWVPERETYVDLDGRPFTVAAEAGRVATTVTSLDGTPLAVIDHDGGLLAEPELLDSAFAAARLSLHRNRLQAELRARLLELQRERDFVADVVNASPAFFCVIDLEGRIIRYNERLAQVTGRVDDENTRGRPFWEVFAAPPEGIGMRYSILAAAPGEHEHRWLAADGQEIVVAWSLTPITDSDGNKRLVITGLDVSERVAHAEEMRRERDFLTRIGQATATLLAVVHGDGTVDERGVNSAFSLATGIDDADAVGSLFWDLVAPAGEADGIRRDFLAAVASGTSRRFETTWRSADDDTFVVEWWVTSLESYRPDHYLIGANDITERKANEDEVRQSRARLVAAAVEERRRLERNLHDGAQQRLVTLSLALRLVDQMLQRDPTTAGQILGEAENELSEALKELRELARGLHPAVLSDRGLGPALEALAERSAVPVELRLDLDRRLPTGVEVAIFYVVSEALTNVAKYAEATSALVHVHDAGDRVTVVVADDGLGGADPEEGTGLRGLVDRVAALDGRLAVESPAGGGTRIVATLPLAEVRAAVPQEAG